MELPYPYVLFPPFEVPVVDLVGHDAGEARSKLEPTISHFEHSDKK